MRVELPEGTTHKDVILLKEKEKVKPSEHIKIVQISPTTTEITIINAKPEDEGEYTVVVDDKEQPLVQLKVIPKPVVYQTMNLPQTTFNEGETLTIKCQFDSTPEENFDFLRNGKPLVPDERISTTVEENTYTIVVENLRPKEDEGVYTLKSEHLILDTPKITVIRRSPQENLTDTENIVEEIEEETIVIPPTKRPEVVDVEIIEKGKDEVSTFLKRQDNVFPTLFLFDICDVCISLRYRIFFTVT